MKTNEPKTTVLVVDDDVSTRRALQVTMEVAGHRVLTASNGVDGIASVRRARPDVVITDMTMPNGDGRALCEATGPLKAGHRFLTIVLTGSAAHGLREWVDAQPDTVLLRKPFDIAQLNKTVNAFLDVAETTGGVA